MKSKKITTFFIFAFFLVLLVNINTQAETREDNNENNLPALEYYDFLVPYMHTNITVYKDGSIDILYEMEVECLSGGDPIDVFDIGFPNDHYKLSSVRAWLDGVEINSRRILKSEYIEIGVEIWLTDVGYIYPGQSAGWALSIPPCYCHNLKKVLYK